jgi:hypothetical protein
MATPRPAAIKGLGRPERFPNAWTHVIDKESFKIKIL